MSFWSFQNTQNLDILMQIEILIRKNLYSETYHHSFSKQFITVGTLKWYKYLIAPYIIATESSIKVKRIREWLQYQKTFQITL